MIAKHILKTKFKKEYKKTRDILKEAKSKKIVVIIADYDGTLFDRYDKKYNSLLQVIKLAYEVTKKGLEFAFVSGRNTTLEVELRELIPKFCEEKKTNLTIWHSGGNGMNLTKITYLIKNSFLDIEKIFSNVMNISEIKKSIEFYLKLKIKPDLNSQLFFKSYLEKKIPEDLVPKKYLDLSKKYEGKIFAELVKVSMVLPTSIKDQKKIIRKLKKGLSKYGLNIGWGGIPFADISKELKLKNKIIDGKLLMVKNIIEYLNIKDTQVVTFGDTPNDNNKGMLTLPYSFTNDTTLKKTDKSSPPFILEVKYSPVRAVFAAIKYLIK